jgi:hypothetical protein
MNTQINVLDYIPQEFHADIKAGTSTVDVKQYFDQALEAGDLLSIPDGTYYMGGSSLILNNKKIQGTAHHKVILQWSFETQSTAINCSGECAIKSFKIENVGTAPSSKIQTTSENCLLEDIWVGNTVFGMLSSPVTLDN